MWAGECQVHAVALLWGNFSHIVDNGIPLKNRGAEGNFNNGAENYDGSRGGELAGHLTDTSTCLHKWGPAPVVVHDLFCFYKVSGMAFRINS